jgi:hypothetical protein
VRSSTLVNRGDYTDHKVTKQWQGIYLYFVTELRYWCSSYEGAVREGESQNYFQTIHGMFLCNFSIWSYRLEICPERFKIVEDIKSCGYKIECTDWTMSAIVYSGYN